MAPFPKHYAALRELAKAGSLSSDLLHHFAIFVAHPQLYGLAGARQRMASVVGVQREETLLRKIGTRTAVLQTISLRAPAFDSLQIVAGCVFEVRGFVYVDACQAACDALNAGRHPAVPPVVDP